MASLVSICNYALSRLGADRITSLSDNTREARLCNAFINDAIDEVLVEGPWAFAVRRADLNLTNNTPEYEFSYEFQLPTNPYCLRVLSINEDVPGTYDYRIEGDKLLADISTMSVKYIARITDPNSFSPMFARALKSKLQALLAYAVTANATLVQSLEKLYDEHVSSGLMIDGQQGSNDQLISPDLHEVR